MRIVSLLCSSLVTLFLLFGCGQQMQNPNVIRVGTIAGPETELMEVAKKVAADKYQLTIEIIPFTDYVMPNQALADGSIDANMFQHQPYLDETLAARQFKLVSVGKTFIYPMGLYSNKIKHLNELANGSLVAVPNDPSNEARALLLLQKAGLIKLSPSNGIKVTIHSITNNPRNLRFKELDAAQLPRVLTDVDLAAINTNYAMLANLMPSKDALYLEDTQSPYANIIVVREGEQNDPRVQKLVTALHSAEVVEKAKELFKGQAIPAWK